MPLDIILLKEKRECPKSLGFDVLYKLNKRVQRFRVFLKIFIIVNLISDLHISHFAFSKKATW